MSSFFAPLWQSLHQIRIQVLDTTILLTGTTPLQATIIVGGILLFLLVFCLFLPLHRKLLKKLTTTKHLLVQRIDEIIYLLTKAQYESHISKKDLGGDPCMALMKEMFQSGNFEYLDNIAIIRENI
jgi:hypothetical protein